MRSLVLALLLLVPFKADAVQQYFTYDGAYILYNDSSYIAMCQVMFPNGMRIQFMLGPQRRSNPFHPATAWSCTLRTSARYNF